MPVQTATSFLAKKGAQLVKAHAATKDKPVEVGSGGLPAGIENGIAELTDCKFGTYKEGKTKGEPFFMATAIVREPKIHDGLPVAGSRTQIGPIPLCDTPDRKTKKTFQDHYDDFLNELKKLGVDTAATDNFKTPQEVESYLVECMNELKQQKPHVKFRTWKGKPTAMYPNPSVNHEWLGVVDFTATDDPTAGVEDETVAPSEEPAVDVELPTDSEPETSTEPEGEMEVGDEHGGEDISVLLSAAQEDPTGKTPDGRAACKRLTEIALEAGIEQDVIDNAGDWSEVVDAINGASGVEQEEEPEASPDPVKGAHYKWQQRDKEGNVVKVKGKEVAAIDVEVLIVSAKNMTVTVKNLKTKATIVGADKKPLAIKWDHLKAE